MFFCSAVYFLKEKIFSPTLTFLGFDGPKGFPSKKIHSPHPKKSAGSRALKKNRFGPPLHKKLLQISGRVLKKSPHFILGLFSPVSRVFPLKSSLPQKNFPSLARLPRVFCSSKKSSFFSKLWGVPSGAPLAAAFALAPFTFLIKFHNFFTNHLSQTLLPKKKSGLKKNPFPKKSPRPKSSLRAQTPKKNPFPYPPKKTPPKKKPSMSLLSPLPRPPKKKILPPKKKPPISPLPRPLFPKKTPKKPSFVSVPYQKTPPLSFLLNSSLLYPND